MQADARFSGSDARERRKSADTHKRGKVHGNGEALKGEAKRSYPTPHRKYRNSPSVSRAKRIDDQSCVENGNGLGGGGPLKGNSAGAGWSRVKSPGRSLGA